MIVHSTSSLWINRIKRSKAWSLPCKGTRHRSAFMLLALRCGQNSVSVCSWLQPPRTKSNDGCLAPKSLGHDCTVEKFYGALREEGSNQSKCSVVLIRSCLSVIREQLQSVVPSGPISSHYRDPCRLQMCRPVWSTDNQDSKLLAHCQASERKEPDD